MNFVFDTSLVLYLPLYERCGSSFMSADAYGHSCFAVGASWRPRGRHFDGTDDYISVAHSESLNVTGGMTIEVWANASDEASSNGSYFIGKGYFNGVDDNGEYLMWLNPGGLAPAVDFRGDSLNNVTSNTDLVIGEWGHVTATFEPGSAIRMYVQAQETGSDTGGIPAAMNNSENPLEIGRLQRWQALTYFPGVIGEVRLYNRALTPLEIQHNYLATKWRYR